MERWVFKWFPCLMESFVMFLCDKNRLCVTLHFRNAGFTTAPFLCIATAAWSGKAAASEDHGLEYEVFIFCCLHCYLAKYEPVLVCFSCLS